MRSTRRIAQRLFVTTGAVALAAVLAACGGAPADGGDETTTADEPTVDETTPEETEPAEDESTAGSGTGDNGVATADVGACVDTTAMGTTDVMEIPTVDCTEEHDAQVVGKFDMEDGDFPGEEAVTAAAEETCPTEFESFVGLPLEESSLSMNFLGPSEETWTQAGDREILCFALAAEPTTSSFEGAGI